MRGYGSGIDDSRQDDRPHVIMTERKVKQTGIW